MRSDHDFTNSHLTRQIALRSRLHSGQAIAISLSVTSEDQPRITPIEVAALIVLGAVAITSTGIFEAFTL
jgi:hypothetical protein